MPGLGARALQNLQILWIRHDPPRREYSAEGTRGAGREVVRILAQRSGPARQNLGADLRGRGRNRWARIRHSFAMPRYRWTCLHGIYIKHILQSEIRSRSFSDDQLQFESSHKCDIEASCLPM